MYHEEAAAEMILEMLKRLIRNQDMRHEELHYSREIGEENRNGEIRSKLLNLCKIGGEMILK